MSLEGSLILFCFMFVYFVTKCFNHKELWRQDFLWCQRCLNAIHLIDVSLKEAALLKTVMSALKNTRFHTLKEAKF